MVIPFKIKKMCLKYSHNEDEMLENPTLCSKRDIFFLDMDGYLEKFNEVYIVSSNGKAYRCDGSIPLDLSQARELSIPGPVKYVKCKGKYALFFANNCIWTIGDRFWKDDDDAFEPINLGLTGVKSVKCGENSIVVTSMNGECCCFNNWSTGLSGDLNCEFFKSTNMVKNSLLKCLLSK